MKHKIKNLCGNAFVRRRNQEGRRQSDHSHCPQRGDQPLPEGPDRQLAEPRIPWGRTGHRQGGVFRLQDGQDRRSSDGYRSHEQGQ